MALLVLIPAFFVLVFASVLGDFSKALGGDLVEQAATAISAGWAAAFLCGALSFFQLNSSRGADRRLGSAGLVAGRVALARIGSALVLGLLVTFAAFLTLFLRTGIENPAQAGLAIFTFAAIYIGFGTLIGALVRGALEGSLLAILVFSLDVFSGPAMTSGGGLSDFTPTRDAAPLLIAAGGGQVSPTSDWLGAAALALGALAGAVFDKLAATYLLLFLAMTDLLIVQNPMFGGGDPASWATLLPGYGPSQLMIVGAFSNSFRATGELVLSVGWLIVVTGAALFVLRRAVAPEREHLEIEQ